MSSYEDIFSQKVNIGNICYTVTAVCSQYDILIRIVPDFNGRIIYGQEIERIIFIDSNNDTATVDWLISDHNDPILVQLMPLANDFAKTTYNLLKRVTKIKAFS